MSKVKIPHTREVTQVFIESEEEIIIDIDQEMRTGFEAQMTQAISTASENEDMADAAKHK